MEQICNNVVTRGDLKQCMKYMLQEDSLRDVTFLVGEEKEEVKAHHFILVARSSVFETMLSGVWNEGKDKTIEVPDADKEMFDEFLRYLYTDEITLDDDNYLPLLRLADKYNVSSMIQLCQEFIKEEKLVPSEIWNIIEIADIFNLNVLRLEAFGFLVRTEACFKSDDILQIKKELLQEITASEDLCINEEQLYQVVVKWILAECQRKGITDSLVNKKDVAAGVLDNIRFSVMSDAFLLKTVSKDEFLTNDEIVRYLQSDVIDDDETLNDQQIKEKPRTGIKKQHISLWDPTVLYLDINFDNEWGQSSSFYLKADQKIWLHGIQISGPSEEQILHVELDIQAPNGSVLQSKCIRDTFKKQQIIKINLSSSILIKSNVNYTIRITIFRTKEWTVNINGLLTETDFDTTKITLSERYTVREGKEFCGAQALISHLILSN